LLEEQASELREQLEQKNREVENTVKQLEETKRELKNKSKLVTKKWYNQEPGHTVYGYINLSNNLITIGKI
jgi:predicted ribosome quality control (RQC) complex YloA/Tae2 family protein